MKLYTRFIFYITNNFLFIRLPVCGIIIPMLSQSIRIFEFFDISYLHLEELLVNFNCKWNYK